MMHLLLLATLALPVGERLDYRVKYGPLTAGSLTLEVAGIEEVQGEDCYRLVSHLVSNPDYSSLFWLNDSIESFARVSDMVTLRTVKSIQESNYAKRIEADFDYENGLVEYSDTVPLRVPGETRDALSLWYYFRDLELNPGDEFEVPSHVDKRNYKVRVRVIEREAIRTRLGSYSCLVIEMKSSGPAGSGTIYLSDDAERLPVVIKTRMPFGYIVATLSAVERGEE